VPANSAASPRSAPQEREDRNWPAQRSWWRKPLVWVGFALSGLALVTFVALFDVLWVWRSLLQLEVGHLLLAVALFLGSYMVRSLRWMLLLRPLGRYPFGQVRDVLLTGFMVNNLLPVRAGELARALVLWRVAGASRRGSLATVGVERLFDGMVLVGLLTLVGWLFDVPPWIGRAGRITTVVLAALGTVTIWLAHAHHSLLWVIERLLFFLPGRARRRVMSFIERFVDGTAILRSPALTGAVLALSLVVWAMELTLYLVMMRGFGIAAPLWVAAITLVATNFGIAVPSAPGHLGVYEAACSGALIAVGVDKERALSYAIGLHLMMFVCITGSGLLLMWRLGLRLRDVTGSPPQSPTDSCRPTTEL